MAEAGAFPPPLETAAATREKAKLRKVLGRFDLVLFTACAILGFDTVAASAQAGAQAVTWLLISLVIFLIPYGMLTAELGSTFPVEGGPYEWARLAFGRLALRVGHAGSVRRHGPARRRVLGHRRQERPARPARPGQGRPGRALTGAPSGA